jgi:hypothetical protein
MASFEQHLNTAVVASGILVAPLYSSGIISMEQSLGCLAFGILGGVLPDIDSDNSKPVAISFKIISIILPLLAVLTLIKDFTILKILFIWAVVSVFLHYGLFKLFNTITVHRGIFHSIPMGVLFGLGVVYIFELLGYSKLFAFLGGVFLFVGFIVHLVLDELVSLNALGMHIKKSFGTALKLYDKTNKIGTIVVYALIIALLFVVDIDLELLQEIFSSFSNIKL